MFCVKKTKRLFGFSLIEVIVSVAIFSIFGVVFLMAIIGSGFDMKNSEDRLVAKYLLLEGQEALHSIRDYDWSNLSAGTYGLSSANGYWELSGSSDSYDKFDRTVTLTYLDDDRFDYTVSVDWESVDGVSSSISSDSRITYWTQAVSVGGGNPNLDTSGAYWDSAGKTMYGLSISNNSGADLVLEEMIFSWTGGSAKAKVSDISIESVLVWSGDANSGDLLDITDTLIADGAGAYLIEPVNFSKNMKNAVLEITLNWDDGTSTTLSGISL